MAKPAPGEVWQVDLGLAAKVRPCLVLSDYPRDEELALILIVPHTTAIRGNRWEFRVSKPFLKTGAFHLQQLQPVSLSKLVSRLGNLSAEEFRAVGKAIIQVLNLPAD
ncbi:MAG: type II toxin-antitoxin system PemK/MazF family toxin [Verrucomicrobiia bacterium]|jgi:mRNA interferase MazF